MTLYSGSKLSSLGLETCFPPKGVKVLSILELFSVKLVAADAVRIVISLAIYHKMYMRQLDIHTVRIVRLSSTEARHKSGTSVYRVDTQNAVPAKFGVVP